MSEIDLLDAFNDCADRLIAGESIEDCLRSYPLGADRLRPLLETALVIRRAKAAPWEVASARARVRARVFRATAPTRRRPLYAPLLALVAGLALALAVILGGAEIASLIVGRQATPTGTPTITLTLTMTPSPVAIPVESATSTPTSRDTTAPSATLTQTPTAAVSSTLTPTTTATPTPTLTGTRGPSATPPATNTARPGRVQTTPTPTGAVCIPAPPAGWVEYRVRAGDTLSALAAATGVSLDEVIRVNCIANPRLIAAGQALYLPFVPPLPTAPTATSAAVQPFPPTTPPVSEPGGANDVQNDNVGENDSSGSDSHNTNDNNDNHDDHEEDDDNDNHSN